MGNWNVTEKDRQKDRASEDKFAVVARRLTHSTPPPHVRAPHAPDRPPPPPLLRACVRCVRCVHWSHSRVLTGRAASGAVDECRRVGRGRGCRLIRKTPAEITEIVCISVQAETPASHVVATRTTLPFITPPRGLFVALWHLRLLSLQKIEVCMQAGVSRSVGRQSVAGRTQRAPRYSSPTRHLHLAPSPLSPSTPLISQKAAPSPPCASSTPSLERCDWTAAPVRRADNK